MSGNVKYGLGLQREAIMTVIELRATDSCYERTLKQNNN